MYSIHNYLSKPAAVLRLLTVSILFLLAASARGQDNEDKARQILRQAVEAAGGAETFQNIENFTIKTESEIKGRQTKVQLTVTETIQLPDKTKQVMQLQNGTRIQVLNGKDSWKQIGDEFSALSALEQREMERGLFRDVINLLKYYDSPGYRIEYLNRESIGGDTFHILQVKNITNDYFSIHINAETFLVHKKTYQGAAEAGLATIEEVYSNYREVEGVMIPYRTVVRANGRDFIDSIVLEVAFNKELDSEFFYR